MKVVIDYWLGICDFTKITQKMINFLFIFSYQYFSQTSDQSQLLIRICKSCLASHILLALRVWVLDLLRWLRYRAEGICSWCASRWSDDLIRWWDLVTWRAFNPMGTSWSTQTRCHTATGSYWYLWTQSWYRWIDVFRTCSQFILTRRTTLG